MAPVSSLRQLPDDIVELWFTRLDSGSPSRCQVLSAEELMEVRRYWNEPGRNRYLQSHIWLRELLARYLDCKPASVPFARDPSGKPTLPNECRLHFSLSHSGSAALAGIRRDAAVGVDLERIDPRRVSLDIARRLFGADECRRIEKASGMERDRVFFQQWTRLEARAKVNGTGVALAGAKDRHRVISLIPAAGFVAAVASRGSSWSIRCLSEDGSDVSPFQDETILHSASSIL